MTRPKSRIERDIETARIERTEGVNVSFADAYDLAHRAVRAGERHGNASLNAEDYSKAIDFTINLIQKYPTRTQRKLACCKLLID